MLRGVPQGLGVSEYRGVSLSTSVPRMRQCIQHNFHRCIMVYRYECIIPRWHTVPRCVWAFDDLARSRPDHVLDVSKLERDSQCTCMQNQASSMSLLIHSIQVLQATTDVSAPTQPCRKGWHFGSGQALHAAVLSKVHTAKCQHRHDAAKRKLNTTGL